jgi:hypothetical protein
MSRYRINNGEFTKAGFADVEQEFLKARALWDLSCRAGFVVPKAKRFDREQASITYEFLPHMISIRHPYLAFMTAKREPSTALLVLERTGATLARIHSGISLPSATRWQPSSDFATAFSAVSGSADSLWMQRVPWSVAHCDYGFSNVRTVGPDGCIAIIDPSANGYVTFSSALYAPVYIDIASFVTCIEGLVRPSNFPSMRWERLPRVREAFLVGYERESGTLLERDLVAQLSHATAYCYFKSKYRSALLARLATRVLFNRFKKNHIGRIS